MPVAEKSPEWRSSPTKYHAKETKSAGRSAASLSHSDPLKSNAGEKVKNVSAAVKTYAIT